MSDKNKTYLPSDSTDRRKKTNEMVDFEPTIVQNLSIDAENPGQDSVTVVPGVIGLSMLTEPQEKIQRVLAPSLLSPSPSTENGLTLLINGKLNSHEQELLFRKIRDKKPVIAGFSNSEDGEILSVEEFKNKILDTSFCFGRYFAQFATEDHVVSEPSSLSSSSSNQSLVSVSGSFSGTYSSFTPKGAMRDVREAHDQMQFLKKHNRELKTENFNLKIESAHETECKNELILTLSAITALLNQTLKTNALSSIPYFNEDIDFHFDDYAESVKIFRLTRKPSKNPTCSCDKCRIQSLCSMVGALIRSSGRNMGKGMVRFEVGKNVDGQALPSEDTKVIDLTEINEKYNLPVANKNKLSFEDKMSVSVDSFTSSVDHPSVDRKVHVNSSQVEHVEQAEEAKMPSKILVHAEKGTDDSFDRHYMNCSSERPSANFTADHSSDEACEEDKLSRDQFRAFTSFRRTMMNPPKRRPQGFCPEMRKKLSDEMAKIMDQVAEIQKSLPNDEEAAD